MEYKQTKNKITLVLLWTTILFNMIFADIFSLIVEIVNGGVIDIPLNVTTMMGIAAILTNIPILMVILSWVLPYKANKWTNIVASSFTILYVIGGGAWLPHYLIIASIEVILLVVIIIFALKWEPNKASV